ncbi:MAG: TetR/AcrR family transcriptional regulator [Deltaproteobacteria bacterium]|jgi:AcrR family transcriptional regulator|nr:TetR/AcrR family transcriptional regulator [Deltaproteobacteria bacterium]
MPVKPEGEVIFRLFDQDVTESLSCALVPTKERILMQSTVLFAEKGYDNISVRDVAVAVGIQGSSIYNHYPSKQALLDAILKQSEDLYFLYLNHIRDLADTAGTIFETMDAIVHNPKDVLNHCAIYALSLVNCEKYRNAASAAIYTDTYMSYSVEFYTKIFNNIIKNGLSKPFDTNIAAIIINNCFHTAISLQMQEYLGLQSISDMSGMFRGVKDFLCHMGAIEAREKTETVDRTARIQPFPKAMLAYKASSPAGHLGTAKEQLAKISPRISEAFAQKAEGFLRLIEAETLLLPRLNLDGQAESIFKSFSDSYMESVAVESNTAMGPAAEARELIKAETELWRKARALVQKKVRDSGVKLVDIGEVMKKFETESYITAKRQQSQVQPIFLSAERLAAADRMAPDEARTARPGNGQSPRAVDAPGARPGNGKASKTDDSPKPRPGNCHKAKDWNGPSVFVGDSRKVKVRGRAGLEGKVQIGDRSIGLDVQVGTDGDKGKERPLGQVTISAFSAQGNLWTGLDDTWVKGKSKS